MVWYCTTNLKNMCLALQFGKYTQLMLFFLNTFLNLDDQTKMYVCANSPHCWQTLSIIMSKRGSSSRHFSVGLRTAIQNEVETIRRKYLTMLSIFFSFGLVHSAQSACVARLDE